MEQTKTSNQYDNLLSERSNVYQKEKINFNTIISSEFPDKMNKNMEKLLERETTTMTIIQKILHLNNHYLNNHYLQIQLILLIIIQI